MRIFIIEISCSETAVLIVAVSTPDGVLKSMSPLLDVASRMPRLTNSFL